LASDLEKLSRSDLKKEVNLSKSRKSYEYDIFLNETVERNSWYEKACKRVGGLFKLKISTKEKETLVENIVKSGLNVKPEEVMGLSVVALFFSFAISLLVILFSQSIFSFILLGGSFYLYISLKGYPKNLGEKRMLEETSEMVLGILYVVIYMRNNPNLERALKFASKNLTGHLGKDFKKLLWDVQTKKFEDIFEAVDVFLEKWKDFNKPFVDSMYLIISALHQINEDKRKETLDRAVDTVLNGTYDSMVRYANSLRTPVQAVSLIGITLPILTLVMLPMVSAFLSDLISAEMIFWFYDIILPIIVYFFINKALGKRPVGFSLPDISKHPEVPPKNKFFLNINGKKYSVPVFVIPLIVLILGTIVYLAYVFSVQGLPPNQNDVFGSLTIVFAIAGAIALYGYLSSFQRVKIRSRISNVETEFTNAAYMLSNLLSEGLPLESALIKVSEELKTSDIHDFFDKIENNIKKLGMDTENAIFDKKYGAINLYPSMLVNSIMRILVSTSKESTKSAAVSMSNIGRYTKSLQSIDEKIKDILSETISSITFQLKFIAPLITGVVVGLSAMIFLILNSLGDQISGLTDSSANIGGSTGMNLDFVAGFLSLSNSIDIWLFQPIVGLYLIIVVILMIYLVNKIESSGDSIFFQKQLGKALIISIIIYIIITAVTTLLFNGLAGMAITTGAI